MKKDNKDIYQTVKIDDSKNREPLSPNKQLPSRDNKKIDKMVEHLKKLVKKSEENN